MYLMQMSGKHWALRFDSINLHLGIAWRILCLVIGTRGTSCTGNFLSWCKAQGFDIYTTLPPRAELLHWLLNWTGGKSSAEHTRNAVEATQCSPSWCLWSPWQKTECSTFSIESCSFPFFFCLFIFCLFFVFPFKHILKFLVYKE